MVADLHIYDAVPNLCRISVRSLLHTVGVHGVAQDFPNVLMFGRYAHLVALHVRTLLSNFGEARLVATSATTSVPSASNAHCVAYVISRSNGEEVLDVCKEISKTQHVTGDGRRIICLLNLHLLARTTQMAFKKVMEACAESSVFVCTTTDLSTVDAAISSRFLSVNCNAIGHATLQQAQSIMQLTDADMLVRDISLDVLVLGHSSPSCAVSLVDEARSHRKTDDISHYQKLWKCINSPTTQEKCLVRAVNAFFGACSAECVDGGGGFDEATMQSAIVSSKLGFTKAFVKFATSSDYRHMDDCTRIECVRLLCDLDQVCALLHRSDLKQAPLPGLSPGAVPFHEFFWAMHVLVCSSKASRTAKKKDTHPPEPPSSADAKKMPQMQQPRATKQKQLTMDMLLARVPQRSVC